MALPQTIDPHTPLANANDILMAANTVLNRMTPMAPKAVSGVNGGVAQAPSFRRAASARARNRGVLRHDFKAHAQPASMRRYPRAVNILTAQSEHEAAARYVSLAPRKSGRVRTQFTSLARKPTPPMFRRGVKPLSLPMQRIHQALLRQNALRGFEYHDTLDYLRDRMHATMIRDTLLKRFQENRMDMSDGRLDLQRLTLAQGRKVTFGRLVYS